MGFGVLGFGVKPSTLNTSPTLKAFRLRLQTLHPTLQASSPKPLMAYTSPTFERLGRLSFEFQVGFGLGLRAWGYGLGRRVQLSPRLTLQAMHTETYII